MNNNSDEAKRSLAEPDDLKDLLFDHQNHLSQAKRRKKSIRNILIGQNKHPIKEHSPSMEEQSTPPTTPKTSTKESKETQTETLKTTASALQINPIDSKVLENINYEDLYIREIIDFLKENQIFLEEILKENDKKKVDKVVEISRDMKTLVEQEMRKCEFDILELFLTIKNKWSSEIKKLNNNKSKK